MSNKTRRAAGPARDVDRARAHGVDATRCYYSNAIMMRARESVTVQARAGTQMNCGGFARITARVEWTQSDGVSLVNAYRGKMRGRLVAAVFAGAQRVVEEAPGIDGIRFTLVEALVHPVDATERRFFEAGQKAMRKALLELVEDCRLGGLHRGAALAAAATGRAKA